jgi:hypothetical protein
LVIPVLHAGPLGAVVDKVKDALGIDEVVDENILEYCSLDRTVSALIHGYLSTPAAVTIPDVAFE